jgi:hypothetical protein
LNQSVHCHEIQQGGHAIEGDLDAITFNPIASTISKLQSKAVLLHAMVVIGGRGDIAPTHS